MFTFLHFVLQHFWPLFNVSFLAVVSGGCSSHRPIYFQLQTAHGLLLRKLYITFSLSAFSHSTFGHSLLIFQLSNIQVQVSKFQHSHIYFQLHSTRTPARQTLSHIQSFSIQSFQFWTFTSRLSTFKHSSSSLKASPQSNTFSLTQHTASCWVIIISSSTHPNI